MITDFNFEIGSKLKEGKPSELDISDRTRLYLQASAWFSERRAWQVLGNHEANLIYTYRSEWKLSDSEKWFLLRSFIRESNNQPGWYWFRSWTENQIDYWVTWIARNDSDDEVRSAALALLSDVGFKANRELLENALKETNKKVLSATLRLLRNTESVGNLDLISTVIDNEDADIRREAISTQVEIMYLNNPDEGFSYLIESQARMPHFIEKTIEGMTLSVDHKLLFEALNKAEASVRRFSAKYLRKSKLLTKEKCHELLKDTDAGVRKEGLLELIEIGENVDMAFVRELFPETKHGRGLAIQEINENDFVVPILKRRTPEDLLSRLDFFAFDGRSAYRVLAEDHFAIIESRIRADLDEDFETLRKDSEALIREKYGSFSGWGADLIEFMRDDLIASAIDGLAKNGQPEDIKYARKYLGKTQHRLADNGAITLLSKFGESSDVDNLIAVSSKHYGKAKRFVLETAYKLSDQKDSLLETLINNDDDTTANIAVELLATHDSDKRIEMAKSLFNSTNDKRRLQGLSIISQALDDGEIEMLLNEYVSRASYYYNIVTWLDRRLYSTGRYLSFYKSSLGKMIRA